MLSFRPLHIEKHNVYILCERFHLFTVNIVYNTYMKNQKVNVFLIIFLVIIVGSLGIFLWLGWALIGAIKQTTENSLKPVSEMAQNISTQVSQVLNPTPTILPDPMSVIHQVRSLSRLETIEFSIEKVVTAETNQGALQALFGDRLLFVAHGTVISGVDLAKLSAQDMWVEDGVLYMRIPEAEVFVATLDNDKSYVYDRQTGLFTKQSMTLETDARRVAEAEIQKAAIEGDILTTAQQNAENYLSRLMRSLGYPEVIFIKPTPIPTE